MEELQNNLLSQTEGDANLQVGVINGVMYSKKIVQEVAEEYNNGHFGCNTNGDHEKCDGCCLTDCKSRNKIWFGVSDDNNGWIPCSSGVMPRANGWYLVTNYLGVVQEQRWSANHWEKLRDDAVLAWRELPSPYQPKGE